VTVTSAAVRTSGSIIAVSVPLFTLLTHAPEEEIIQTLVEQHHQKIQTIQGLLLPTVHTMA
jgi:hypothetical protein